MAENIIYEYKTPEGTILEWEGPEGMDPKAVKLKFFQSVLKQPELSPSIAKSQGYKAPVMPDERSASRVALDQTVNVGKGVVGAVTGIPGMIGELGGMTLDAVSGNGKKAVDRGLEMAEGMYEGVVAPIKPIMQTAAPGTFGEATREGWEQGATAAGGNLAGLMLPEVVAGVRGSRTSTIRRGVDSALPKPETLMGQAASGRAAVSRISDPSVPFTKFGVATQAVKAAARPAINAGAATLEKLAKIRAGRPLIEGASYAPETQNVNLPETDTPAIPGFADMRPDVQAVNAQRLADLQRIRTEPFVPEAQAARPPRTVEAEPYNPELFVDRTPQPVAAAPVETFIAPAVDNMRNVLLSKSRGGAGNVDYATRVAESLLEEVPELANLPPGDVATRALFDAFKVREAIIDAGYKNVKPGTMVDTAKVKSALEASRQKYQALGDAAETAKIVRVINAWDSLPDTMPFPDFLKVKRAFFDAGERVTNGGLADAYGALMEAAKAAAPETAPLARSYSTVRSAMDVADISLTEPKHRIDILKAAREKVKPRKGFYGN